LFNLFNYCGPKVSVLRRRYPDESTFILYLVVVLNLGNAPLEIDFGDLGRPADRKMIGIVQVVILGDTD